jgi:hypothetical protein
VGCIERKHVHRLAVSADDDRKRRPESAGPKAPANARAISPLGGAFPLAAHCWAPHPGIRRIPACAASRPARAASRPARPAFPLGAASRPRRIPAAPHPAPAASRPRRIAPAPHPAPAASRRPRHAAASTNDAACIRA